MKNKFLQFLKNQKYNIFGYTCFLIAFVYLFGERIVYNFENEGTSIETQAFFDLEGNKYFYPNNNEKNVIIFWASWCTPCKVEMDRLQRSITEGKIPAKKILAINPFESIEDIKKFNKIYNYQFKFLIQENNQMAKQLKVSNTPTIVFFDGLKIKKMSSGISLTGILAAEKFLKQ